ncbi:MAG: molecular chaperone DnaJ [Candidatus Helarchaeota archaeon]
MSVPHDIYQKDLYKILGLRKEDNPSQDDIKRAYRKLVKKYHPDINKSHDAEEKFKEINLAHEILSDPQKRRRYDSGGMGFFSDLISEIFGGGGGFGGFGDIFSGFGSIFGRRSHQRSTRKGPQKGRNLRYEIELTLEEAFTGVTKKIEIPRAEQCPSCNGSGAKEGTEPTTCPSCNGTGEKRDIRRTAFGQSIVISTCSRCHGEGSVIKDPCKECNGSGKITRKRTVTIRVPKGAYSGLRFKLSGEGDAGVRGGPPGDLYVEVYVREHSIFHVNDHNIIVQMPIKISQALLGDTIEVPTLDWAVGNAEKEKLKIPKGTSSGDIFTLKKKGFPILRNIPGYDAEHVGRGDQIVQVVIDIPRKLTNEQKAVVKQLKEVDL